MRLLRQACALFSVTLQEVPGLHLRGGARGASGSNCPCPTALCIVKADTATVLEVALSLSKSYGQKQMQT